MAGGGSGVGDPRGSARARCPGLGPGLRPALYYSIFPCPGLRPARDEREFSRARACCANSAGARLAHQAVAIAARCCIKPNPQNVATLRGHTPALFSPGKGCDRDRPRPSAPSLQLRGRAIARSLAAHIPSPWPARVGEREGTLLRITAAGQSLHARFGGHRQVHQQRVAAEKHPGD